MYDSKISNVLSSLWWIINRLKGYFSFNPVIAFSLTVTIYSFVGIPPLLGFFGKQMVLSAALDNGFIFLTLIAILTSVISAVYYLNIIKQIFFDKFSYTLNKNPYMKNINENNIKLAGAFSISISCISLIIILFIFNPQELLNYTCSVSLLIFNP